MDKVDKMDKMDKMDKVDNVDKVDFLDKHIGGTEKRHSFAFETQKADAHSRLPFVWRNKIFT